MKKPCVETTIKKHRNLCMC